MHVVQSEARRSSNVELSPIANMPDQINACHLKLNTCVPLEPIMVWAWPLGLPGETIGSTRESRTDLVHGIRQKALEEGISRSPSVKRETIICTKEREKKERQKERREGRMN